jgi:hypothetical protein
MLAGQLINEELVTTQVSSDVQAHDEPIVGAPGQQYAGLLKSKLVKATRS